MKKRGFEFSFAWFFALIVGAVILFMAIYAAVQLIDSGRRTTDTLVAKQLTIVFEPMELGLASGKSSYVELNSETRLYNDCSESGTFGKHEISVATKSGIGKEWDKPGGAIDVPNKYIFSKAVEEGKKYYFFSKAFEMPFKVSEIIFLTTRNYCFQGVPDEISSEISGLNLKNVNIGNCSARDIRVCFDSGSDCDIEVTGTCSGNCESDYDYGFVRKGDKDLFYVGNLMYGAIFADEEVYECNVKRLMKRLTQQALLYRDQANYVSTICGSGSANLIQLVNAAKAVSKSEDLARLNSVAEEADYENSASQCGLW